jgi:HemY protein
LKKQPEVVTAYVTQLAKHAPITGLETTREMEELIRKTLKTGWYPELAKIYGRLNFADLNKQLVIVGAWVKMYGQQPELLFILGKTCARLQLWGKAKEYFAKCLQQGPNAEASLAYGRLLESLGENEEALQKYREGLTLLN